jgi:hypothetical protein
MRDDNYNYRNNRVYVYDVPGFRLLTRGTWEVAVSYEDKCRGLISGRSIGYVVVP